MVDAASKKAPTGASSSAHPLGDGLRAIPLDTLIVSQSTNHHQLSKKC
jgi:hypothetical protein